MTDSGSPVVRADNLPSFVHPLSSGLVEKSVDPMTQAEHDEVNRRCDEIREARARAEVTGRDYIIF